MKKIERLPQVAALIHWPTSHQVKVNMFHLVRMCGVEAQNVFTTALMSCVKKTVG